MALEQAMSRTRDTRRFIADGLEYLPVATLISDPKGQILLDNLDLRQLDDEPAFVEQLMHLQEEFAR